MTTSVTTATYKFDSLVNGSPVDGVPGLTDYCVYPSSQPDSVLPSATGADGSDYQDFATAVATACGPQRVAWSKASGNQRERQATA